MKTKLPTPRFKTLALVDVPCSRSGKHKKIVAAILRDLDQLGEGAAFRVPLAELGDTKENVRSALNRATRKASRDVATATDQDFLYVWNLSISEGSGGAPRARQPKLPRKSRPL
jgi:hypothetical protein